MKDEVRWLPKPVVLAIQAELLSSFGGAVGLRDENLFASALARPQQLFTYEDPDIYALAAAYAYGMARNHPFVDGNTRIAFGRRS